MIERMSMQQIGWVVLGLLSALGLGFILGLARPHPRGQEDFENDTGPSKDASAPFTNVPTTDEA